MNRSNGAAVLNTQTETNCDFCKETDQSWDDGDAHEFRMNGNGLFYHDYTFGWEGIRVNYCPMCGRRLDGTTHAQIEVKKNEPLTLEELRNIDGKGTQ